MESQKKKPMEGDRNRYEGAAGNTLLVMDAGDGDIAFRIVNNNDDPGADVILLRQQVDELVTDLRDKRHWGKLYEDTK